ncbi:MAG: isoprenylcysteine carboxylmethyltransferase family protein [Gammaproteobacteria bacterium]|jgi:protein-S-isoprenylcysteine O-methyltransferase Ste14
MTSNVGETNRKLTGWSHVRAVLALPFMNTVVIPTILLVSFRDARLFSGNTTAEAAAIAVALPFLAVGLTLVSRAIMLFVSRGHGTLAPWDPTEVLITEDIYRFSRNPMKAGLFLVLIGEAVLLRSTAVTVWALTFIVVNAAYIRLSEEPGLRARFGDDYTAYCRAVPRWFPLLPARRTGEPQAGRPSSASTS